MDPRLHLVCIYFIYDIHSYNFRLPRASFPVTETHQCPDSSGFDTGPVLFRADIFPLSNEKVQVTTLPVISHPRRPRGS